MATVGLAVFGLTDIWEIWTGSWYQPTALLVLNSACVVTLLPCLLYYYLSSRTKEEVSPYRRAEFWNGVIKFSCGAPVGFVLGFMFTARFFKFNPDNAMAGSVIGGVLSALILGRVATRW